MNFLKSKGLFLLLVLSGALTGCKDPEIMGEWTGPEKAFKSVPMVLLIYAADKDFVGEGIKISELSTINNKKVFYVTLGEKNYSKKRVEQLLSNVAQQQAGLKSTLTINFTDPAHASDEHEKRLLGLLKKTGRVQEGRVSTELDWANAKPLVYTDLSNMMGYGNLYIPKHKEVYCGLKVPFKTQIPNLVIEKSFPYITSEDIPDALLASLSSEQQEKYVKDENDMRRDVNNGLELKGYYYPHSMSFSDDFMKAFSVRDAMLSSSAFHHTLFSSSIILYYGEIPDVQTIQGFYDMGGVAHNKCEEIIKEMTPELDKKRENTRQFTHIGKLVINPDWKTEE